MNFQTDVVLTPLKVLVVNPITPFGQMIICKILSGFVFGENQLIDLILLVYSNEVPAAERLKLELIQCAYSCYNIITVTSDLPSAADADIFCFLSHFYNVNKIELENMDSDEQFDALYLIIKIANNFTELPMKKESEDDGVKFKKKKKKPQPKPRKPIFMADGLVTMDILMSLSKSIPSDVLFCPTMLPDLAKIVLGDYLKIRCDVMNDVYVWAANDAVFHVEVEKPIIKGDKVDNDYPCDWDMVRKDTLRSFELDHTQFSPSWMKKEFIEKMETSAIKNPYGCIFKATLFARALKTIWTSRTSESGKKFCCNMGVVSDGSLGTTKGYPYVLPLVFCGESWSVNKCFEETAHLKSEMKRINKAVKKHHQTLIPFCKRFLQDNVVSFAFIPAPTGSSSTFITVNSGSKTSI